MAEFRLPDVGEGLTEAVILTWRVAAGDQVAINDVLLEIETAKSIVELPSPFAGTVTELLIAEGETVEVGTPIVRIDQSDGAPRDPQPDVAQSNEAPPGTSNGATPGSADEGPEGGVLVGYGPRSQSSRRRRRAGASAVVSEKANTRVLAKPPVRRLAKELGIDLAEVPHEGDCVKREDLEAWARQSNQTRGASGVAAPSSVPASRSASVSQESRREPLSAVRKATADAMVASAFSAPHASEWVTVDVSESVALLERMRKDPAFHDIPVSILVLAARAVCLALRRNEIVHAQWDGDAIVHPAHLGLGIAAATERGLLVPVVPAAETLSTPELAQTIHSLVSTAREGRLQPEQMTGGTFTITNVGIYGVDGGTPILPPGQSGILALGAVVRRPWVDEETDQIVPRWVMTLSMSFDHRVVDGEPASKFLANVAGILRTPALAATF